MPVRLRITFIFTLLVFIILSIVCTGIYYFSYTARIETIKKRLTNRAITTARLLSQKEIFDQRLVQRIDSLTTIALKKKVVQAYDYNNRKIYSYSDVAGDTLLITDDVFNDARLKGDVYFTEEGKEAVAYHYVDDHSRIVIVSAGEDVDGKETLDRLLNILLVSFLIGNVLVLVGGYLFSGGLVQPIKKITDDVAEISAQNLARRIHTGPTKDEWYQLSHTLNELLDRLQKSFELQRRFISNASHELSTPLTSISSQLEVSLQKERSAEDYRKVMESIYQDVRHMSNLTQTLLEFAKASGNAGGLEIDLVRIDEILLQLPSEIVKVNSAYSILLEFDNLPEDEKNLLVFGNETLLLTAIKNIVINACKYSSNHQAIVHLQMQDENLLITVEDKGYGIPEEELAKIFQPFYRVDEARSTGGFGLGLSLAERIIKLHKGTIKVESEQGQGTRFFLQLPAARSLSSL
jgi:two-component system, OmpR family, sensor histidine kinase ArlS